MTQLIKIEEVMDIIPFCKAKIVEMGKDGNIPSAIKFGRCLRWDKNQLYQWIHLGCPALRDFKYQISGSNDIVPEPDRLIKTEEIAKIVDVSRTKLHELRTLGHLPKPVKFGRSLRWRLSDIYRWIDVGCPRVREFEKIKRKKKLGAVKPDLLVKNAYFLDYLNISKGKVWLLEKAFQMPQGLRFGMVVRWKKSEIDEWIQAGCPTSDTANDSNLHSYKMIS